MMSIPFLTATWSNLIVVNYKVDSKTLIPYLPAGVELDLFEANAFLSLVAFRFSKNKLFGVIPIPAAYTFEEINLRFYVKRRVNSEIRRGVVFIKEIVPSRLIILEHYWGYTCRTEIKTSEYQVEHIPWQYRELESLSVSENFAKFYDPQFEKYLRADPHSAFLALGSPVKLYWGHQV